MAKSFELAMLLDVYGDMLTERQYDTLNLYYNDDLSLAEIAELHGITRQGVHKCIRNAEEYLVQLETTLKLAEKYRKILSELKKLQTEISNSAATDEEKAKTETTIEKIRNLI